MKIHLPGVKSFILDRYGSLLVALLAMMLLQLGIEKQLGRYILEGVFIVILFSGLRAIGVEKTLLRFEVALLLVSLALCIIGAFIGSAPLFFSGLAGRALFLALVAIIILVDLFRSRVVSADTLSGAVCVYLMIALVWAYIYMLVEYMAPGSFSFTQGHERLQFWVSKDFFPFFYFSMVTMTTVGYGDMAPLTHEARTFASLEAIVGQLYLTILVARLVGMHLAGFSGNTNTHIDKSPGDHG